MLYCYHLFLAHRFLPKLRQHRRCFRVLSSFSFRLNDTAGNGYVFTLPRTKINSAKINAGSINTDVQASFEITGLLDPVTNKVFLIDRGGVAVTPVT